MGAALCWLQLGTALPSIVPKLSETLADPHPKVQAAARQALTEARTPRMHITPL